MPGFNQRGPMNEGPMTGRRMGVCASDRWGARGQQPFDDRGYGMGMARRRGRGRCLAPGWGAAGWQSGPGYAGEPQDRKEILKAQADRLAEELAAVKKQLSEI